MAVVEVNDLSKTYHLSGRRTFEAVKKINFEIEKGEVFGFLGLNGAGKTTTIKILTTVMEPSSGEAFIDGHSILKEPMEIRRKVGLMPESPGFYPNMKGVDALEYYARFYMDKKEARIKAEELVNRVGLSNFKNEPTMTYSRGMLKRLALATSLVNDPKVLILDEPTSGLDPKGVNQFKKMMKGLARTGMTVFFSSHVMGDIEEVCDRVLIIHKGSVVGVYTLDELKSAFVAKTQSRIIVNYDGEVDSSIEKVLYGIKGVCDVEISAGSIMVMAKAGSDVVPEVNFKLASNGVRVRELRSEVPSLEKLFLDAVEGSE